MDAPSSMRSAGLKFAEQQMQRHGWMEGKGLGKREDGISEAIKVKVKCDKAGVGHNSAEQFTFHWWDHVFNKTASSIAVEADEDGVQVKKVSEDDGAVSSKKPRKAMLSANMLYGRFIKSATLMSGGEKPLEESSSSSAEGSEDEDSRLDLSSVAKLSDEDLVKICGGRTAHKGARHGLTMSAKLSRIEEQEKAFMEKYGKKENKPQPSKSGVSSIDSGDEKKKRRAGKVKDEERDHGSGMFKKKKKKQRRETCEESVEEASNGHDHVPCLEEDTRTSKNGVELTEEAEDNGDLKNHPPRPKKKRKKTAEREESTTNGHTEDGEKEHNEHENAGEEARKSKKKKQKEGREEVTMADEEPGRKSKKKCQVDQETGEEGRSRREKKKLVDNGEEEEENTGAKKKKKKSKRED